MGDILFLVLTAAFFAASFGLIHIFEKLRERR